MPAPPMSCAGVVELRQYTLRPGTRATLVDLFESRLVEPQEDAGMRVGGTFSDRDDPDRFVWFRGFADMATRLRGLADFYGGPVWAEHSDAANATMIDSDDVLLLRPTEPAHPPADPATARPAVGAADRSAEWVVTTVHEHRPDDAVAHWLATEVHAVLQDALETPVATWRTEPAANTFPRLPVRPDTVFVWSATFPDQDAHDSATRRLEASRAWTTSLLPRVRQQVLRTQRLRLQPTPRSQHPAARRAPRA